MKISLKAARVNRNLKQVELAEKMGVTDALVSQWENGVCEMSAKQFCLFCDVVEMSRDDILLPSQLSNA